MQSKEEKQELDKRIGKRFKELIRSRGLTQQQVADAIPLSKQSISNICSGHQDITPNVSRFAEFFGVSTDYLLCRSDYKTAKEERQALRETRTDWKESFHARKALILDCIKEMGFDVREEAAEDEKPVYVISWEVNSVQYEVTVFYKDLLELIFDFDDYMRHKTRLFLHRNSDVNDSNYPPVFPDTSYSSILYRDR